MNPQNTFFCRLLLIVLAAAMLLGLAACRNGEDNPTVSPVPVTSPAETSETPDETSVIETPTAETAGTETSAPTQDETVLVETEDMGQGYLDKIIFLGDSTTYGLRAYSMLSGGQDTNQVWTPASGTLTLSNQSWATIVYPPTGEEISIRDAVEAEKPEIMIITLGVNGVSFLTEDGFKSEYTSLVTDVQAISPDTKIILQSIYPVESDYKYLADINNDKITAANGWIKEIAEEMGVKYLDTYPLLLGSDGFMDKSYGNGDGIHLGTAGFEVVLKNIRTHAYE
ncbi:MAG: SGNH/GDSL hydrolase family protein [Oscillospiraceae bacterium]